ncbi:MAG: DUF928 domain-containing protein [Crinalium sp.]
MFRPHLSIRQSTVLLCSVTTAAYVNFLAPIFVPKAQAQNVFERISQMFNSSRGEGNASGRSRGGATRSQCSEIGKDNLLALVPQNNGGLTTQEYPQFWFYLPFGGNSQSPPAKFRLLDEQKQSVLTKPLLFSLPEKKGIVSINLPSTEKPLLVGKKYYWYFNISCVNPQGSNTNISVNGWLERVEASSDIVKNIQQPRSKQHYIPYAEHNLWYETVSQLAINSTVYQQDWSNLLSLFQLEEFANFPVYELKMKK